MNLLRAAAAGLVALACIAPATAQVRAPDAPLIATIEYRNRAELQQLGSRFQHVIVDADGRTATVEATSAQLDALRRLGFKVEIDEDASMKLAEADAAFAGGKALPNYACYRTVEETYATMDQLAADHPTLASVVDIGPSWAKSKDASAGYTMRALVLGNRNTDGAIPDKANMIVTSAIHAREFATAELMTRFGEWLVDGYGTDPEATWLMDRYRFHLVLQTNPDGRKRAEPGVLWRKNVNDSNACVFGSYGVDLNRNFPFHWGTTPSGSSGDPCAENYRGPTPASEPETQNVLRYVAGTQGANGTYAGGLLADRRDESTNQAAPDSYRGLYIDIHSPSRLILWPWGDTIDLAPNDAALRTLGKRLAWFGAYTPMASQQLYFTDGTTADSIYGLLGAPSYAYEIGRTFFENCTVFAQETLPQNLASLRYAARTLDAPYRLPSGPDAISVTSTATSLPESAPVTITATVSDARFQQMAGSMSETVDVVTGASAYVDQLPWEPGAVAIPMSAVDGAFNAPQEQVRATIPATALTPGRHTIYVQGVDARGQAGAPNAVIVTVAGATTTLATGWYWNPQESGRGFFIEERGGKVYTGGFHYAANGRPDWYVSFGNLVGNTFEAPMNTFANGQTLTGPYVAPTPTTSPGTVRLDVSTPASPVQTWTGGTTPLVRFPFANGATIAPPQAGAPESGWWWNPVESGRGYAIEFQGDAIYVAAFLYAADGTPTWYVTGGAMETPTRYRGTWQAFRDGQAPGAPYRAPQQIQGPGAAQLDFTSATTGTLTLPDGRAVQIVRFQL